MTDQELRRYLETWPNMPDSVKIAEIMEGGTMTPCPFCKVPRVERTDYVRCCRCSLNWLPGENLDLNPSLSREPYLSWKAAQKGEKKQKEEVETGF